MFRNVTLGQYYKEDSVIHRLDPRVKLFGTLMYVITLFFSKNPAGLALAAAFLSLVIGLSKVPVGRMLRGLRPLFIIILLTAVMNLCFTEGQVLASFGPVHITREGLYLSAYLVVRIIFLVMGSSVMTYTTTAKELTDGIEKALGFLKVIRLPVHEFAMMMSIALRFIPILTEELNKIMEAQMARGIDFEEGNVLERARKLIPILVPLFVAAIRRANGLALAMEARCYHGGEGRTKLHPLSYQKRDYMAYGILILYALTMLGLSLRLRFTI